MPSARLLYYITDRSQFTGEEPARRRALLAKVADAACAGVDYIQLREKDLRIRDLEQLTCECVNLVRELRSANRKLETKLLINSRADVALATGADGVHLRSNDISPEEAFGIWTLCGAKVVTRPARPVVAVSCHTKSDLIRAESENASFAVFAPVFEKKNAPGAIPQGLNALREACRAKIPVLALGGVTFENAANCIAAGAAGIAAIRLFQENRIDEVVRALRAL